MHATVAVVGGGYGGTAVAKALDDLTHVILIEPRDAFVHNVAALRGLTEPEWTDSLFFPYDRLLDRGRVLRDRAVSVDATSVTLGAGTRISADYIVLATGSAYPFPAKVDTDDSTSAKERFHATRNGLSDAGRVLLLGAGPVGLELAGEIKATWPDKKVTIVDRGADIVTGDYPDEFRAELRRQLDELGVELLLGTSPREVPGPEAGEHRTFTVPLSSGAEITADIWFRCYGVSPVTDYLADELTPARRTDGVLEVTPELRLYGQQRVFAIGDITATPEAKQAAAAQGHADVVAANIRTLLQGDHELTSYQPGPPGIVLPLGPRGGATYAPGWESYLDETTASQIIQRATGRNEALLRLDILDAETTSQFKGSDLMAGEFIEFFGLR